jgi:hypothetical protein
MLIAAAAVVGLFCLAQTPAQAQYISPYNPYRAFNTTGVNYGSQRLQQQYNRMYGPAYGYSYGGYGYGSPVYGYRSAYGGYGSPVYSQQGYRNGWYPRYYSNSCR